MADPEAVREVFGEPGWALLLEAGAALDRGGNDALRTAQELAKRRPDTPGAVRATALELVAEGRRLAAKLGIDEQLLAVREAVEQASAGRVATWHAQRIPADSRILEIGCGCGADTLALAHRAKNLIACDTDPVRAACAHMNLMALDLPSARALPEDGFALLAGEAARADVVFVDPDRRPGGVRTRDPEEWTPPLSAVLDLVADGRAVYVKAASSLDPSAVAGRLRITYVSHGGECVESFLEPLRKDEPDVAAVLLPNDGPEHALSGARGQAPSGKVGAFLHMPDPAAIRASLLAELCLRTGTHLIDPYIALLTGADDPRSPWLRTYRVLEVLPMQLTAVGRALRRHRPRSLKAHVRGLDFRAPELQRRWRKVPDKRSDGPELDLFATREENRPIAILAVREPPDE